MPIIIKAVRGTGDREAPSINDALITTNGVATARGKRWLDDPSQGAYYLVKKRTLKVPHKGSDIPPRSWITVTDGKLGLNNQKLKVKSYNTTITPTGVWATIETEQYSEFSA
jgi:hypothetical protein